MRVPSNSPITLGFGATTSPYSPSKLPQGVLIDSEDAHKLLSYNKWYISKRGDVYAQTQYTIDGKRHRTTYKLHRVIMDAPVGMDVDHINGNPLDNRRSNLRVCTHAQNSRNLKIKKNNTSGSAGVTWDKAREKWAASIKLNYKHIHLGRFKVKDEAISARKQAEKGYFKEFARNA